MVDGVGLGQPRVDMESARRARLDTERSRLAASQPATQSAGGTPSAGAAPGAGGDEVAISLQAAQMQRARQAVDRAPDVRQDKVAEVRQQIASGEYRVSSTDIARRMLSVLG